MANKPPIQLWKFDDAPPEYKALWDGHGRPDWLAFLPPEQKGTDFGWGNLPEEWGTILMESHNIHALADIPKVGGAGEVQIASYIGD